MNAPQPLPGFGKLGNFCRKILSYAKSLDIQSIIIERLPTGVTTPPTAEITSTPTGKMVRLKINSGAGSKRPFELIDASNSTDGTQVRVVYSTIEGTAPTGFVDGDDPPYVLAVTGDGSIWMAVTVDGTGAITARVLDSGASVPADTSDTFFEEIGTFSVSGSTVTVSNSGFGPAYLCRDWFSNPATYSLILQS